MNSIDGMYLINNVKTLKLDDFKKYRRGVTSLDALVFCQDGKTCMSHENTLDSNHMNKRGVHERIIREALVLSIYCEHAANDRVSGDIGNLSRLFPFDNGYFHKIWSSTSMYKKSPDYTLINKKLIRKYGKIGLEIFDSANNEYFEDIVDPIRNRRNSILLYDTRYTLNEKMLVGFVKAFIKNIENHIKRMVNYKDKYDSIGFLINLKNIFVLTNSNVLGCEYGKPYMYTSRLPYVYDMDVLLSNIAKAYVGKTDGLDFIILHTTGSSRVIR